MKLAAVLFVVACAPATQPQPTGVNGYTGAAVHHDEKALAIESSAHTVGGAPTFACGDTVLQDQTTSAGERLDMAVPCFDVTEEATNHARFEAHRERAEAAKDRKLAANLAEAELHSCKGIPEREREHSPFAHRSAIASVTPVPHGVSIAFKPVNGLSAAWMERAIQCHQARFAALGNPSDYLPGDPTLVPGAHVSVTGSGKVLTVLIETPDADSSALALQRAQELTATESASN